MSSLPRALRISRNVCHRLGVRVRDDLCYQRGRLGGEAPAPALLPLAHKGSCALVVDDRGASPRERQPAACALRAAPDRPGPGRAAALTEGLAETDEQPAAGRAERASG